MKRLVKLIPSSWMPIIQIRKKFGFWYKKYRSLVVGQSFCNPLVLGSIPLLGQKCFLFFIFHLLIKVCILKQTLSNYKKRQKAENDKIFENKSVLVGIRTHYLHFWPASTTAKEKKRDWKSISVHDRKRINSESFWNFEPNREFCRIHASLCFIIPNKSC